MPTNSPDPAVQRQLDALAIAHDVVECDPALADTDAFCDHYGIPRDHAANTILVASKGDPRTFAACLVLATTKLDVNHKVSKLLGIKRLSFASAEDTKELTGQLIGGVTIFGLPDLPIYIDSRIVEREWVIVGGGNRSTKLRLAPAELRKLPRASVADIALPR